MPGRRLSHGGELVIQVDYTGRYRDTKGYNHKCIVHISRTAGLSCLSSGQRISQDIEQQEGAAHGPRDLSLCPD